MHRRCCLLLATLFAAALACAPAGALTPSASTWATSLAQTAAALLTSTAAAHATLVTPVPTSLAFTASPAPTATTTPSGQTATPIPRLPNTPTTFVLPTPCENDSAFVSDVTIPDGTHFAPGTPLIKTWRLRNDGVCAWTTEYTLRLVGGEAMRGATVNLPNAVPAEGSIDISVALVAPNSNGRFSGRWQLHSPEGAPVGAKPFVEIVVP